MRLIPGDRREAGLALGLSRWRVTTFIVLPEAAAGIATGAILAIGRVAGETAPLILTALGSEYLQTSLTQPIDELTLRILKYSRGPYEVWHEQAFAAAFVLVMLVAIGSLALRFATRGRGRAGALSDTARDTHRRARSDSVETRTKCRDDPESARLARATTGHRDRFARYSCVPDYCRNRPVR